MTTKAEDLLKDALELPEDDRAELAGKLISSLDPEADEDVEAAWADEIARRIAAIDSGDAQFVSLDELKRCLSPHTAVGAGRSTDGR